MSSRPTAVNLRWALDDLRNLLAPLPPAKRARRRLPARRRDLRRGCRDLPPHRRERARPDPQAQAQGRPHQRADPLQRGLARHRRLGHRAGADLPGARCRHPDPCLGRRDPTQEPGRQPDGLGTRQARRAAHRDRRQCRRPSDAARPGRLLHRRHRPHDAPRRRLQQDRHLPEGAGGARQRRARSMSACPIPPSTGRSRTDATSRSRSASAARSRASPAAPSRARSSRSTCCPRAARPPIPPSTSRRRAW